MNNLFLNGIRSGFLNGGKELSIPYIDIIKGSDDKPSDLNKWYNWLNNGKTEIDLENISTTNMDDDKPYSMVAYGDGKFVALIGKNTNLYTYSTDGINWTEGTMPSSQRWQSVTYGNDKFVAIGYTYESGYGYQSSVYAYSEDGINWTEGNMPFAGNWSSIAYGDGKFVVIINDSSVYAYSEDGINWTRKTLPDNIDWMFYPSTTIIYGKDKFIAYYMQNYIYSYDGINWIQGNVPAGQASSNSSIRYGNDKFIFVPGLNSETYFYSEDGINWTQGTLPNRYWLSMDTVVCGHGVYIILFTDFFSVSEIFYSEDGINWSEGTLQRGLTWVSGVYGNNKFVMYSEYKTSCIPMITSSSSVFTDTEIPNLNSKVYSEPKIESSLSITSVGENTITLSDNGIYTRNIEGDIETEKEPEQDEPDIITIDVSKLKFGDRLGDIATVVGDYTDGNGQKYKFAVLDEKYRGNTHCAPALNGTDTGLPNYQSENDMLNAKESATYNTDYILNNYSGDLEAFTFARNAGTIEINGKTYQSQLPNYIELKQIQDNASDLDSFDTSITDTSKYGLALWSFNSTWGAFSSNEFDDWSFCLVDKNNQMFQDSKSWSSRGVLPIFEIPYGSSEEEPDEPSSEISKLKLGDRLGDMATVVGDYTDGNGQKYKFAVLDGQYVDTCAWDSDFMSQDLILRNYSSEEEVLNATESATYNTDRAIELNGQNQTLEAFRLARNAGSIELNGKRYQSQLPNIPELKQIYDNREVLYSKDPTNDMLKYWDCAWSSNEKSDWDSWTINSPGYSVSDGKWRYYSVLPIFEIPYE